MLDYVKLRLNIIFFFVVVLICLSVARSACVADYYLLSSLTDVIVPVMVCAFFMELSNKNIETETVTQNACNHIAQT